MEIVIRTAGTDDASVIATLAIALTQEIIERTQVAHFDIDPEQVRELCAHYLEAGLYTALLAMAGNEVVGFATLCESHSLYAGGRFGIVQEFYVVPAWRSRAVGQALLDQAYGEARNRRWRRLELCTPPLPEFERTLAFYQDNGFEVTGGRKMKYVIEPA